MKSLLRTPRGKCFLWAVVPLILLWLLMGVASWRPRQLNEKPDLAIPAPLELPSNAATSLRVRLIPPFIRSLPPRQPRLVAVSHDGSRALIETPVPNRRSLARALQLWDVQSGRLVATLEKAGSEPGAISRGRTVTNMGEPFFEVLPYAAFSLDGKYIATAFDDLRLWDARSGRFLRRFDVPDQKVHLPRMPAAGGCTLMAVHDPFSEICSLDFTYDNRYLIVCSDCIYKPSGTAEIIWRWRVQ